MNGTSVDLALVLDASGSLNYDGWAQLVTFCINFIERLTIGPSDTQVAVIVFGSNAAVQFHFGVHNSRVDLEGAIKSIQYTGGSTNLNEALFLVWSDVYASGGGSRPGVNRIAVIITDGEDTENVDQTPSNATKCKDNGIRLMAVGVGNAVNAARLRNIVSVPSDRNYYNVSAYSELAKIMGSLGSSIQDCHPASTFIPIPIATTSTTTCLFDVTIFTLVCVQYC